MRIKLKGINPRRKTLADGRVVTYYYAWKGGPRLHGAFGSPEFIASYHEAVASRRVAPLGTLQSVLDAYQQSGEFLNLADRTRSDYIEILKGIERTFGDFPIKALTDRRARGEFLAWRDRLAVRSRRQADYAFTVLARVLSWSLNRGIVDANPCEKAGRLYRGSWSEKIWTDDDEAAFYANAPAHLHLPLTLAL
jgi:integrase